MVLEQHTCYTLTCDQCGDVVGDDYDAHYVAAVIRTAVHRS